MAQPSLAKRAAAHVVAVGAGAVGTVVLGAMVLADCARGRRRPAPPRNT